MTSNPNPNPNTTPPPTKPAAMGALNRLSSNQGYAVEAKDDKKGKTKRTKPYDKKTKVPAPTSIRGTLRTPFRSAARDENWTPASLAEVDESKGEAGEADPEADAEALGDITLKTVVHTPPGSPAPEAEPEAEPNAEPEAVNDAATASPKTNTATVAVPTSLRRPCIPPITDLFVDEEHIPADFVRDHLDPHLRQIFEVVSCHEPMASTPSSPAITLAASGLTQSMAFGIPEIVNGEDTAGRLAAWAKGREPDMCLAIPANGSFRVFPVNHMVYAARCAFFPKSKPLSMRFVKPTWRAEAGAMAEAAEGTYDEHLAALTLDSDIVASTSERPDLDSDAESVASSTDDASVAAALDTGAYVHLPMVSFPVPSPSTFELVHQKLHFPALSWLPQLLCLGSADCGSPDATHAALANVPAQYILHRIQRVRGVWQNMCALGVDDGMMWTQVDQAYRALLRALAERAGELVAA